MRAHADDGGGHVAELFRGEGLARALSFLVDSQHGLQRGHLAARALRVDPHDPVALLLRLAREGAAQRAELLLRGGQLHVDVLRVPEHQLVQERQKPRQRHAQRVSRRRLLRQRGEEREDRAAQREVRLRLHRCEGGFEDAGQCRAELGNAEGVEKLGEELVGVGVRLDVFGAQRAQQDGLGNAQQRSLRVRIKKKKAKANEERLEGGAERADGAGEAGEREGLRADLRGLRNEPQ